jgi:hypothetical protein
MLKTLLNRLEAHYENNFRVDNKVMAIMHPGWRGIRSSTENLFDYSIYLGDEATGEEIEAFAEFIAEIGIEKVVLSGFPHSYDRLVNKLKKIKPSIKIFCLWHGSFLQSEENYNWQSFKKVSELCKKQKIYKWGFTKKGMAEIIAARLNVRTSFVMNYVKQIPLKASEVYNTNNEIKIAVWAISPNWRKNPFAMIAAASMIPNSKLYGFGQNNRRVAEFIEHFGVKADIKAQPLPQYKMMNFLGQMHVNLYVTMSECAPMTPLESLAAGAPCLIGPNSHYFEDNDYLKEHLIVKYPDKAMSIHENLVKCIENRAEIINEYIKYAPIYNQKARESMNSFIEQE